MMDSETKFCSNCKRNIAVNSFMTHEVHCFRNIKLCQKCNEPVPISEMDLHFEEYHKLIPCELCSQQIEIQNKDEHLKSKCIKRSAKCEFCEMEMSNDALSDHVSYCGTRTEQCPKCKRRIMVKDQVQHDFSSCAYPSPRNSPPSDRRSPLSHNQPISNNNIAAPAAHGDRVLRTRNVRTRRQQSPPELPAPRVQNGPKKNSNNSSSGNLSKNNNSNYGRNVFAQLQNSTTNDNAARNTYHAENRKRNNDNLGKTENHELIPCEFCSKSFPMEDYIFHQTACELSHNYRPFAEEHDDAVIPSFNSYDDRVNVSSNILNDEEDIALPCEFCGNSFPADQLVQHESGCADGPVNYYTMESRQEVQPKTLNVVKKQPAVEQLRNEEQLLPCEFCGEVFNGADKLYDHQSNCVADSGRISRLSATVSDSQERQLMRLDGIRNQYHEANSKVNRQDSKVNRQDFYSYSNQYKTTQPKYQTKNTNQFNAQTFYNSLARNQKAHPAPQGRVASRTSKDIVNASRSQREDDNSSHQNFDHSAPQSYDFYSHNNNANKYTSSQSTKMNDSSYTSRPMSKTSRLHSIEDSGTSEIYSTAGPSNGSLLENERIPKTRLDHNKGSKIQADLNRDTGSTNFNKSRGNANHLGRKEDLSNEKNRGFTNNNKNNGVNYNKNRMQLNPLKINNSSVKHDSTRIDEQKNKNLNYSSSKQNKSLANDTELDKGDDEWTLAAGMEKLDVGAARFNGSYERDVNNFDESYRSQLNAAARPSLQSLSPSKGRGRGSITNNYIPNYTTNQPSQSTVTANISAPLSFSTNDGDFTVVGSSRAGIDESISYGIGRGRPIANRQSQNCGIRSQPVEEELSNAQDLLGPVYRPFNDL